jgi:AhpD family alkylhydroperoxidase
MRVAVLRDGPLAPLLAELVLFSANIVEHRADFAAVHARGARRAGVSEAQLVEAGLTAVRFGGVAAWFAAAEAIVETRHEEGTS